MKQIKNDLKYYMMGDNWKTHPEAIAVLGQTRADLDVDVAVPDIVFEKIKMYRALDRIKAS